MRHILYKFSMPFSRENVNFLREQEPYYVKHMQCDEAYLKDKDSNFPR